MRIAIAPVARRLDANVGVGVGERQHAAVVDEEEEFRRQGAQRGVGLQGGG